MDPIASATRKRDLRDSDADVPSGRPPAPKPSLASGVQAHVDAGIAAAARNARPQGDGVLYLGMNGESSGVELRALQVATHGNVTAIAAHRGAKLDTDFGTFDLTKKDDVDAFAASVARRYGLTRAQGAAIGDVVKQTDPNGRDEIGRLALAFARADSGVTPLPSRLVLSGHSSFGAMWGTNGAIDLESVIALGKAMPHAAAQLEDIHFSGCFTAGELQNNAAWKAAFPNLKTMWGYDGFSHHAPVDDIRDWEDATRGAATGIESHTLTAHTSAAAWSVEQGVVDPTRFGKTLDLVRANARAADARYGQLVTGATAIHDPDDPNAVFDYAHSYELSMRSDASPAERSAATQQAQTLVRLRYYERSVRGEFQKANGAVVGAAFENVGLPAPDFSKLGRKDALAAISDFRAAAGTRVDVADAAERLTQLASLDPKAIPSYWCH